MIGEWLFGDEVPFEDDLPPQVMVPMPSVERPSQVWSLDAPDDGGLDGRLGSS